MPQLLSAGETAPWQYGWTVANLVQCLSDHLNALVSNELFKCPNAESPPTVSMAAPFVYANFIPAAILSYDGLQNPPIVPSILIECHAGEVVLPHRPNYLISTRILVSVWDDDPSYAGYQDSQHLTEKIFLYLLKERSLSDRYLLTGKASWKALNSHRSEYFISLVELTYDLDPVPDASDNVDQWLNKDHVNSVNVANLQLDSEDGTFAVLSKSSSAVFAVNGDDDALATTLPTLLESDIPSDMDC